MTESSPECASSAESGQLTALEFGRALPIEFRQTEVRIDAATRLQPAIGIADSTIHPAQGGGDEN